MNSKLPLKTLVLLTTAGCTAGAPPSPDLDPMIGSWDCTSATGSTPCPFTYSESGFEQTTYMYGLDITSADDAQFVWIHIYDYASPEESFYAREVDFDPLAVTVVERGHWRLAGESIELDCTAGDDQMACDVHWLRWDESVSMEFGVASIERTYVYEERTP